MSFCRVNFALIDSSILSHINSKEKLLGCLEEKTKPYGRLLLILIDYFIGYSEKFDESCTYFDLKQDFVCFTLNSSELARKSRSEIDIQVVPLVMNQKLMKGADFSYPYEIYYHTFITPKAKYKPELFDILKMVNLSIWMTIVSVMIMMVLIYRVKFKKKQSYAKIFLHVFAVFLRQNLIMKTSSMVKNF